MKAVLKKKCLQIRNKVKSGNFIKNWMKLELKNRDRSELRKDRLHKLCLR